MGISLPQLVLRIKLSLLDIYMVGPSRYNYITFETEVIVE